mgnify:FL=1
MFRFNLDSAGFEKLINRIMANKKHRKFGVFNCVVNTYRLNPNLGQLPGDGIRPAAGIAEHRRFRRCLLYAGDQRIIHILTGGVGTDAEGVCPDSCLTPD